MGCETNRELRHILKVAEENYVKIARKVESA
jgi:hypothetical protein